MFCRLSFKLVFLFIVLAKGTLEHTGSLKSCSGLLTAAPLRLTLRHLPLPSLTPQEMGASPGCQVCTGHPPGIPQWTRPLPPLSPPTPSGPFRARLPCGEWSLPGGPAPEPPRPPSAFQVARPSPGRPGGWPLPAPPPQSTGWPRPLCPGPLAAFPGVSDGAGSCQTIPRRSRRGWGGSRGPQEEAAPGEPAGERPLLPALGGGRGGAAGLTSQLPPLELQRRRHERGEPGQQARAGAGRAGRRALDVPGERASGAAGERAR